MGKIVIALCALLCASAASAADLSIKAPPRLPAKLTCPSGTGFYAGINTYAQVANGTTTLTAPATLVTPATTVDVNSLSDGAAIGLTAGYTWGDCASGHFYSFEGMFDYQNLTGTSGVTVTSGGMTLPVTAALNSHWEFTQKFKIGANLSDVMTFLPNFGVIFPGFPPIAAPGTSNPKAYIAAIAREEDVSASFNMAGLTGSSGQTWAFEPGLGVGIQSATAGGSVVDVFIDYTFKGAGFTFGANNGLPGTAATSNIGGVARAGIGIYW